MTKQRSTDPITAGQEHPGSTPAPEANLLALAMRAMGNEEPPEEIALVVRTTGDEAERDGSYRTIACPCGREYVVAAGMQRLAGDTVVGVVRIRDLSE